MPRKKGYKLTKPPHKWSTEEIDFIRSIAKDRLRCEIAQLVFERFGFLPTTGQIKGIITRHNIKTGFSCHLLEGQEAWNQGKKGLPNTSSTKFKKGRRPSNYKPIGTERINTDGYTEIKVSDESKWVSKQRVVYEQHKGKIPKGHAVIFGDGDKTNFDIDNLILVSRGQLAKLNQNGMIYNDIELTKTAVNVVNVMLKINEIKRR